jgi:hypothetical protein
LESPNDVEYDPRNAWGPVEKHLRNDNFKAEEVRQDKENLRWDVFKDSLDPYWKVGNMIAIWKKIYNLLWPHPAKKRWQLTHVNVLQEMIDAVLVDEDGAPNKSLIKMARERYNNSLTNLTTKQVVMVSKMEFLPPSSSHISSGFSGFTISTPDSGYALAGIAEVADLQVSELLRIEEAQGTVGQQY